MNMDLITTDSGLIGYLQGTIKATISGLEQMPPSGQVNFYIQYLKKVLEQSEEKWYEIHPRITSAA